MDCLLGQLQRSKSPYQARYIQDMNTHSWQWTCNGLTFDVKWQAIREHNRSGKPILLLSPREYDSYPMHQEPTETWEELLRERAQSIRDSAQRVNIMLSGGRDSTKVVDTFVSNGIFIDEITCIKHGIPEADHEVDNVALPYLAGLDLDPRTRVNVITRSIQDYKQHYGDPYWIEKETRGLLMQFRLTNLSEDLCYANSESGTTWVSGKEKPTLVFRKGRWYCYFLDHNIEPNQSTNDNAVFFYSGSAKVHAKQAHMLKNYITRTLPLEQYQTPEAINSISQNHIYLGCGRIAMATDLFIPKSRDIFDLRDHSGDLFKVFGQKEHRALKSILKDNDLADLMNNFRKGISNLVDDIGQGQFNDNNPQLGTVGVFSKFYGLDAPETLDMHDLFPDGWTGA